MKSIITSRRSWLTSVIDTRMLSRIFPLMALLALLGCSASTPTPAPEPASVDVPCDDFDEQPEQTREVTVDAGSTLTVALCANPTTGFQWEEIEIADPDLLKEVSRDYEAPDTDKLGASGREVWTFRALTAGETTLTSTYGQPWEGGTKEHWTFELTLTVD